MGKVDGYDIILICQSGKVQKCDQDLAPNLNLPHFVVFSYTSGSGSGIALILFLAVIYFCINQKKEDMTMCNFKINQIPTPIISNIFNSFVTSLWAIGCSAAATLLTSSK